MKSIPRKSTFGRRSNCLSAADDQGNNAGTQRLMAGVTALLLAGSRPGIDPLAAHFGASAKALVPLAGEAMLSRVARALVDHPRIGRVVVLAQANHAMTGRPDTAWMAEHPGIMFESGGDSVSEAVAGALERYPGDYPFLVTTADHGLLDTAMIDAFIGPAERSGADVAVAVVERQVLEAAYPDNKRTWLRFRGGSYSGANLFWFAGPRALNALRLWRTIEQERKRGRAIIRAFGPLMLAAVGLRLLTLPGALRRAGRRLGLSAAAIELPIAEACIDIDKVEDHALATRILAARGPDIATIRS
jgi:GTP:adenosylcobinamide-phosphate guanylyltransferase